MSQKTILITGSTDGIGKGVAIKFAKQGHKVYIHGRNIQKVEATIQEIKDISGNESIHGFVADFGNLDAVKAMSKTIKEQINHIDILINNAGIYVSSQNNNTQGLDLRFTVNYFAAYILTQELVDIISLGGRVINLSSAAQAAISNDVLTGKLQVSQGESYAQSKLALTMWSINFAKQNPKIGVIAVNPGSLLNTKMAHNAYGQSRSSADKGIDILYDLSLGDTYGNISGEYYDNDIGSFSKAHLDCYDKEKIQELITITQQTIKY